MLKQTLEMDIAFTHSIFPASEIVKEGASISETRF